MKFRHRRKWRKFPQNVSKVRQHRKELLNSYLVEEALHKHKSNSNNGILSSRNKELRGRSMIFQKPNAGGESEPKHRNVPEGFCRDNETF